MTTPLMVTGGTTPVVLVKPREVDPSCHLRDAVSWSQRIDDVRDALGGDYWNCTLATPVRSPNTRTDLDHANFQAVALLMRSVSPDIRKHIKDGYDHTPAEVLQMIKKAVGTGTVPDILIRLQALLDVEPPPIGMDAFAKYQATTIELFNTLLGHGLTFE